MTKLPLRRVGITDHISTPTIEENILGDKFSHRLDSKITDLLVWHETIDEKYLAQFQKIYSVVRYGVGYDNIDLSYCKDNQIRVCNTPDYGVDEVADTALAMMLSLSRGINALSTLATSIPSSWQGHPAPSNSLKRLNSLNVGIIGLGRIGTSLALKAKPIFNSVSFYDPYITTGIEKSLSLSRHFQLKSLLETSDIVSINCNLTGETKDLVDHDFLNCMRKGSILINVSRGGIYSDMRLIEKALISGKLAGFGSDVWISEPPSFDDKAFHSLTADDSLRNKVIINPHTAYFSEQAIVECRTKAATNIYNIIHNIDCVNIIV